MIIRVEIDLSHRSNLAQCPPLSGSSILSEYLSQLFAYHFSQCRMGTLPPPARFVDVWVDGVHLVLLQVLDVVRRRRHSMLRLIQGIPQL